MTLFLRSFLVSIRSIVLFGVVISCFVSSLVRLKIHYLFFKKSFFSNLMLSQTISSLASVVALCFPFSRKTRPVADRKFGGGGGGGRRRRRRPPAPQAHHVVDGLGRRRRRRCRPRRGVAAGQSVAPSRRRQPQGPWFFFVFFFLNLVSRSFGSIGTSSTNVFFFPVSGNHFCCVMEEGTFSLDGFF